jgi:hypothetical protein
MACVGLSTRDSKRWRKPAPFSRDISSSTRKSDIVDQDDDMEFSMEKRETQESRRRGEKHPCTSTE